MYIYILLGTETGFHRTRSDDRCAGETEPRGFGKRFGETKERNEQRHGGRSRSLENNARKIRGTEGQTIEGNGVGVCLVPRTDPVEGGWYAEGFEKDPAYVI